MIRYDCQSIVTKTITARDKLTLLTRFNGDVDGRLLWQLELVLMSYDGPVVLEQEHAPG